MDDAALSDRIVGIIADTFGADPACIGRTTVADDVDGWDSLGHSVLMVRLSRRLGIEIDDWTASESRSVGHLIDLLLPLCRARQTAAA
jgi:acyl carrier protein